MVVIRVILTLIYKYIPNVHSSWIHIYNLHKITSKILHSHEITNSQCSMATFNVLTLLLTSIHLHEP